MAIGGVRGVTNYHEVWLAGWRARPLHPLADSAQSVLLGVSLPPTTSPQGHGPAPGCGNSSDSPWASAMVLVPKKDGEWHFCIDYRCLNNTRKKDLYTLPQIDESLDLVAASG